jgi:acetylornithine deacetylase/succinyl-diaminopimelate desuccinylase-like protein
MPATLRRRSLPSRFPALAGGALALVAAAVVPPRALAAQGAPARARGAAALTPHQQLAREIYRELVEINTVDSVGSVTRAAEAMAARFRAAGFPAADVQLLVPPGHADKGNLVVRYRGRRGATAKPILLLAHLDVVAALRSDWPRDPFVLHEENGYFLGRGTADDKAMAAIFVANLLRYKQEGWVPERDLVLALTADEEGGDANGVEFLIARHKALIDAAYAINEGGGGSLDGDRPLFHSVQAAEKVPVNFTLTATNPGGHSSVPRPDNAIYQLTDGVARLARYQFPVALNEVTRPFFTETAKVETRAPIAAAMRTLVANPTDSAAAATISTDSRYASMLRTTCVATRLLGGHAYNALPQTATANVNCRIVPTSTLEEVRATLARVVGDTGIRITLTVQQNEKFGAPPSPVEPGLLAATTALTRRMWGDIPVIPTMSTGATDGRFLRAAGIPTYGVSGLFSAPGESNAHGRDEKLRVKSFYDGQAFLYELVKRVAGTGERKALTSEE